MTLHPDDVTGGSLNEVRFEGDRVVKSYSGSLERGYEKLRAEADWLAGLSGSARALFAPLTDFRESAGPRRVTELHLERVRRIAATKGVLAGTIGGKVVSEVVDRSLSCLLSDLYPIRADKWSGDQVYTVAHRPRILLAKKYLRKLPYVAPFFECSKLEVNGVDCPPVDRFLVWLDGHAREIFRPANVVAVHGNFHMDNVLVEIPWQQGGGITFIDPRGDQLGPPHTDISKLLITLDSYYDEIHYGHFAVSTTRDGSRLRVNLTVHDEFHEVYRAGLRALKGRIADFAACEGVETSQFRRTVFVTQCIHVLSFCFYHAYREVPVVDRVRAYLAICSLLAKRAMDLSERPSSALDERLSLDGGSSSWG